MSSDVLSLTRAETRTKGAALTGTISMRKMCQASEGSRGGMICCKRRYSQHLVFSTHTASREVEESVEEARTILLVVDVL